MRFILILLFSFIFTNTVFAATPPMPSFGAAYNKPKSVIKPVLNEKITKVIELIEFDVTEMDPYLMEQVTTGGPAAFDYVSDAQDELNPIANFTKEDQQKLAQEILKLQKQLIQKGMFKYEEKVEAFLFDGILILERMNDKIAFELIAQCLWETSKNYELPTYTQYHLKYLNTTLNGLRQQFEK